MVGGWWLVVVGCWLLVVGCWLLVVGCWLLVVGSDACLDVRCVWSQRHGNARTVTETLLNVPSHLEVKILGEGGREGGEGGLGSSP